MEKGFHLYLTNYLLKESQSHSICVVDDIEELKDCISNIIRAMFKYDRVAWWYSERKVKEYAEEFTKPFIGKLDYTKEVLKKKYCFYDLGFIITNYPMWPDNNGCYLKEFPLI